MKATGSIKLAIAAATAVVANAMGQTETPIAKLLVFPEANQVRVECTLKPSPDTAPLSLDATIRHTASGELLWEGPLGGASRDPDQPVTLSSVVRRLAPRLWEPHDPNLYNLAITARQEAGVLGKAATRFGFRSITTTNGQFRLNGRPIFLRGIAINPPGRTIPNELAESRQFAEAYVRYLKSQNVNIFRLSIDASQTWFDVCDELGMMLYAGRYGSPPGTDNKKGPPEDFAASIAEYKSIFEGYVNHPSIIMYYLSNELPVSGPRGEGFSRFLTEAHAALQQWDPTRPYIGNAGYGEGREGDVCDVHRYWGWYYNSFLTYYNLRDKLRDEPLFGAGKNQPLTFTECVGSFTGSSGEFNVVRSKQLGPRLGWIGATEAPVEDSLAYQSRVVKEATESFRRMRPLNPRLAGIMPFSIFFYNWSGIDSFEDMMPKPALDQLRVSYQPILLSWENWTHQVYAGMRLRPIVHVINDSERGHPLTNAVLNYAITALDGKIVTQGSLPIPDVRHFGTWSDRLDITVPKHLLTAEYLLTGSIQLEDTIVSTNWTELFVAEQSWGHPAVQLKSKVHIYDPSDRTTKALALSGIEATPLREIKEPLKRVRTLVIGENAWNNHLSVNRGTLREFVRNGGRIVCLQQRHPRFPTDWLPARITMLQGSATDTAYPPVTRPHREQSHVNMERPSHPVFMGLDRKRLSLWSDYTRWDQTLTGFPRLFPVTAGFRLTNPEDLAKTAVLADYDRGLEGVALCEIFDGSGSVIFSGLDLVNRAGLDPAADRLLANLLFYAADAEGHDPLPVLRVDQPVYWGQLHTEQGLMPGSLNGLVVNAEWMRGETQDDEPALPANTGAWNMMPGDQFVPSGRNPFGPYTYSTASSLRSLAAEAKTGEGFFYARCPGGVMKLISTARNPGKDPALFRMTLNGKSTETTIAPGQQGSVILDLPWETELHVRFSGPKDLVLVETRFE